MTRWVIQLAAAVFFGAFVWRTFRFAMQLRSGRVLREEARRAEELRGRRVVAEVPSARGEWGLFTEDAASFFWAGASVAKAQIQGCRLLLNGGAMAAAARGEAELPLPSAAPDYDGKERWEVRVYLPGGAMDVPCGTVREGVSREAAQAVFDAVKGALTLS